MLEGTENRVESSLVRRERDSSIDCLRLLGAFFVVFIHSALDYYNNDRVVYALIPVVRTAVPLFFMISGYYLYSSDATEALAKCKKALVTMIWLTIYANLFYIIIFPPGWGWARDFIKFIFTGIGCVGHLWYLTAYIETLVCFIVLLKLRKLRILLWLSPLFYVFGLLFGTYSVFLNIDFHSFLSRCFLTFGIPFVALGWIVSKYKEKIMSGLRYPFGWLILTLLLAEAEVWILPLLSENGFVFGDGLIFIYPLSFLIFVVFIKNSDWGKGGIVAKMGKRYATFVYIYHMYFVIELHLGHYAFIPVLLQPVIIMGITIVFAAIWEKLSRKVYAVRGEKVLGRRG